MSTKKKHRTTFKKTTSKKSEYWGSISDDNAEPHYTAEQKKRIQSYLKENDENCKESTTLILIIVIGLLVALSIVGFLAIRNNSAIKYKGSHVSSEHSGYNSTYVNSMWGYWEWLQDEFFGSKNGTDTTELVTLIEIEKELDDFQPIYRNPLLQSIYAYSDDDNCAIDTDDDHIFQFISIKHGSWIPSDQYMTDALDFAWANEESDEEKDEILLEETDILDSSDETEKEKTIFKKLRDDIFAKRGKDFMHENMMQLRKDAKDHKIAKASKQKHHKRRLLGHHDKYDKHGPPHGMPASKGGHGMPSPHHIFGGNKHFDIRNSMPNPANILMPHKKGQMMSHGDEGEGDITYEEDVRHKHDMSHLPDRFKSFSGHLPDLLNRHGPGLSIHDLVQQVPGRNKDKLKHFEKRRDHDERRKKMPKILGKDPRDILQKLAPQLDKLGFKTPDLSKLDPHTRKGKDDLKEALLSLEEEETARHPYMTLLTNPGDMSDINCLTNGQREHTLSFISMDDKQETPDTDTRKVINYSNNVLQWYCYLVEVNSDTFTTFASMDRDGQIKVNLTLYNVNIEHGFDHVDIYINSDNIDSVSGKLGDNNQEEYITYINDDYLQRFGYSVEVCMKIQTDSNVIGGGFNAKLQVDYDDPSISTWTNWDDCTTVKPWHQKGAKNERHWDGRCGVGVRSKAITACLDSSGDNNTIHDRGVCQIGENVTEYCVKANCYEFPMVDVDPQRPNLAFLFNGHGRVDPDYADPYLIERSQQTSFNLTQIILELAAVRAEIINRYPDERVLATAVINHEYMDDSKLRLGIRLIRSLLLGDTFTVYTTGSSNTAGHENMFLSTWPMQFQSIMRPIWRRIGYKGAAFRLRNHANGGGLGTKEMSWCMGQMIGDDADVVYWESIMNDHGIARDHTLENHMRNIITLPRRPLYHLMHAGKNGPTKTGYDRIADKDEVSDGKDEGGYVGYENGEQSLYMISGKGPKGNFKGGLLNKQYVDYGAGITEFFPANGINSINKTKYPEFSIPQLYVSWHPGPPGHRVYAEMLAYHYLTCAIDTLTDIKDLIEELDTDKPIEEMLEILEDPPRSNNITNGHMSGQCDPLCTNATESICITGYQPIAKKQFSLKKWRQHDPVMDDDTVTDKWSYQRVEGNKQAFVYKQGGQASNDLKYVWKTTTDGTSDTLRFIFEAKQYGYVNLDTDILRITGGKTDKGKEVKATFEVNIKDIDHNTGEVPEDGPKWKHAGKQTCIKDEDMPKDFWLQSKIGCIIGGLTPYQKYEMTINSFEKDNWIKNIRIF